MLLVEHSSTVLSEAKFERTDLKISKESEKESVRLYEARRFLESCLSCFGLDPLL